MDHDHTVVQGRGRLWEETDQDHADAVRYRQPEQHSLEPSSFESAKQQHTGHDEQHSLSDECGIHHLMQGRVDNPAFEHIAWDRVSQVTDEVDGIAVGRVSPRGSDDVLQHRVLHTGDTNSAPATRMRATSFWTLTSISLTRVVWTFKSRPLEFAMATRKGEATKARILEAAADLLVSGNDINLDEVTHLTRTSKGQLFHYFPEGKEDLRRAAAERHLARLVQADTPAALATWQDWESWIEQILRLHERQGQADACEVAALAGRALDTDRVTRDLVGRMYEQWAVALRDQLTAMQASGLLREDAPVTELASTMLAALQGGAVIDKATGSHQHLARPCIRPSSCFAPTRRRPGARLLTNRQRSRSRGTTRRLPKGPWVLPYAEGGPSSSVTPDAASTPTSGVVYLSRAGALACPVLPHVATRSRRLDRESSAYVAHAQRYPA